MARQVRRIGWVALALVAVGALIAVALPQAKATPGSSSSASSHQMPISQMPISISELPVPPTAPSTTAGSCTAAVNPHGTGCVSTAQGAIGSPGFIWDPHYVLLGVVFAGAPAAPDPASAYSGTQVLLVKTDGTVFPNGDPWKCLTCGIPGANEQGVDTSTFRYPPPHAFPDDRRVLVGNGVLDCGAYLVTDARCTPQNAHIYPIDLGGTPLGGMIGGVLTREWRLNPDGVHLGWNGAVVTGGNYDEFGFVGRLAFNQAQSRYDLADVSILYNGAPQYQPYAVEAGNRLKFNPAGMIGEYRGWTSDGRAALGVQSYESDSIDGWATSLATGRSRPVTHDAQYVDPMSMSPNGRWTAAEEVAGSGRLAFISAMPGIAPITDQLPATGFVSGLRNNGQRRFFLPYLVDNDTGRSRQVNPNADPNWNAWADPVWLADSTAFVWPENLVTAPACGGTNPLPCPLSTEPGGRHSRLMIARFSTLHPTSAVVPAPIPDAVPWGTPYTVGQDLPVRAHLPAGTYTLPGAAYGSADVVITADASNARIMSIQVRYDNFSDDGVDVINGSESSQRDSDATVASITWHENLTLSGRHSGTKVTSPDGFTLTPAALQDVLDATGTMTTTIDGRVYTQPGNGD